MFSAAELIEVLQQRHRRRFPLHADRPFGGFPPTWRAWFLSMGASSGAVLGAPAADYVAVFAARPPRPVPKASPPLDRWRAYARLARQQWDPAPRDQRGVRRFAATTSGLLHLVFAVLLLWLGLVPIGDAPPEAQRDGEATLVEYIGVGTPVETGGEPAPGELDAPPAAAAASAAAVADSAPPATAAEAAPMPPATSAAEEAPAPPTEAAAPQPLVVTETPKPDIDFALPPPVQRDPTLPRLQVRVPELAPQAAEIETFEERTQIQAIDRPTPRVAAPRVPTLRTEVAEVEAQQLPTEVAVREAPPVAARVPQLRVPELRTQPGEVQLRPQPSPAPAAGTGTAPPAATAAAPAAARTPGNAPGTGRSTSPSTAPAPGGRPQANGSGRPAAAATSGAGPSPSPRPGAAPSPVRGDDWGASNRNVPGNSTAGRGPGLFNNDGSIRLPGDGGRVGGGLPPGTVIEDFEKIDRMGTWLKRPPLDYTPTRFDRFWIPHENLLEEWVRRGIKNVAIPLPGTSKRIMCTVSLLQAGGGCTIDDPNLQDQEAIARPPPDVPFKPELQQDQDSLRRPPPPP
ncbi:MAG: hypothetical protein ACOY82_12580 [Pseudomonadota bacterium]